MWHRGASVFTASLVSVTTVLIVSAGVYAAKQITLRAITWDTGDGFKTIQDACNEFTRQNPNIKVKLETWADYDDKLLVSLGAGTAPDVFMLGETQVGTFCYTGFVQSLDGFIRQDKMDMSGLLPELKKSYMYKGQVYGLPKDYAPFAVFYNKDILNAAGVSYPTANWTWDECVAMAKKLVKYDSSRKVKQTGLQIAPGHPETHIFVSAFNGSFMAPEKETFDGYLNSRATIEALQYMADIRLKERVLDEYSEFANKKTGLQLQGPWTMATFSKIKNFNYGIVAPPIAKRRGTVIMHAGWCMSTATKYKQESWKFVKFMGGPEGNKIMGTNLWAIPAWRQTIKELGIEKKPDLNQLLLATEGAETIAPIEHPFYHRVMNKYVYPLFKDTIWVGKGTAVSTLPAATVNCDNEYNRYLRTQPKIKKDAKK